MFLKSSRQRKIEALKKRDKAIEASYLVDDDTADMNAIMRQGKFLGIYEQLVRILHRNTDNIPEDVKNLGFCRLALEFPEGSKDIGNYALSKFLNMDYENIVDLPESIADQDVQWVNATRRMLKALGIRSEALLWLIEQFMSKLTEQEVHYGLAEEFKPTAF